MPGALQSLKNQARIYGTVTGHWTISYESTRPFMLGVEDGDKSKAQPQAQNNRIGFGVMGSARSFLP